MENSCIDLFAGCGGLSLGFSQSGWNGAFAIEKDPMAFESLRKNLAEPGSPYSHYDNWPKWLPKDNHNIKELLSNDFYRKELKEMRGKISLIAGGPPCQGFSVGGARRGCDERNDLVFSFVEMVDLVRPDLILIENVEGITRAFNSRPGKHDESVIDVVIRQLNELGYEADFFVAKALDAGVPQDRKRVITFGIKKELIGEESPAKLLEEGYLDACRQQRIELGLSVDSPTTIGEALHDLAGEGYVTCPDSPKFQSCKYLPAKSAYAKLMRRGRKAGTVPDSHRFSQHGEKVLSLYKKAHQTQKPGRLSKSFLLSNNTKTHKKFLLGKDIYASTLTTHPDEHIHYKFPRNVSLREMARLQSFPDDFHFYGRYTLNGERRKLDVSRCAQIGNAVPPLLSQALGQAVLQIYKRLKVNKVKSEVLNAVNNA